MSYTRRISVADAVDAGYPNYLAAMPVGIESATVVSGYLGDGAHPPLHIHDVDQFFVVVGGSAIMWLAHDAHQTKPGELIYIPAGYPHGSSNDSGGAEHHLEIMVPGVLPGAPYLRQVESADAVPLPAASPYVKSVSAPATEETDQERRWVLADESTGSQTARITAVERTRPGTPGTPAGRDTDRLVVVTEGQLDTEIAGRPGLASAEAVIVIPAGVPHRIWNSSSVPVRYLDIDLQTPAMYAKLAPAE
jgi:mannose-6-phosphate isomerase-like protein (cupin superfamily)